MGSQQTREIANNDLNTIQIDPHHKQHDENYKFSNDVCLIIFSFINSEENFYFLIKSCSPVCRQWRSFIRNECGLRMEILCDRKSEYKKIVSSSLKYFNISSVSVMCMVDRLGGKSINGICKGLNACNLKELRLNGNQFNDSSVRIIVSTLPKLEVLMLKGNLITDKSLSLLSQSENMKNLRALDVVSTQVSEEGIIELTSSRFMKNIEELHVSCGLSMKAISAIVDSFKLKTLVLPISNLESEAVQYISNSENMSRLTYLNVIQDRYWPEYPLSTVPSLAQSPHVKNLTYLNMTRHVIEDEGAIDLFSSENMANIRTLIADGCGIGSGGAMALASNPFINNLRFLSLKKNGIGSGFNSLIESERMKHLTSLDVF